MVHYRNNLTYLLTYSLTYSFTHSLTYLFICVYMYRISHLILFLLTELIRHSWLQSCRSTWLTLLSAPGLRWWTHRCCWQSSVDLLQARVIYKNNTEYWIKHVRGIRNWALWPNFSCVNGIHSPEKICWNFTASWSFVHRSPNCLDFASEAGSVTAGFHP